MQQYRFVETMMGMRQYTKAVQESAKVFEFLMRDIYMQCLGMLDVDFREAAARYEREKVRDVNGFRRFTFGHWLGLEKQTGFLKKWAARNNADLSLFDPNILNRIKEIRNQEAHPELQQQQTSCEASKSEAEITRLYLQRFLEILGFLKDSEVLNSEQEGQQPPALASVAGLQFSLDSLLLGGVKDLYPIIISHIEKISRTGQAVEIVNFGLDHETVWPNLVATLIDTESIRNVTFKGLIIDPEAEIINQYCQDRISPEISRTTIGKVRNVIRKKRQQLEDRGILIDLRAYGDLPIIHGFGINRSVLFLSMTEFAEDELSGGFGAYLAIDDHYPDQVKQYFIKC